MTLEYKCFKKAYRLINYAKRVLVSSIRRLINLIIPNLKFIISGRLSSKNIPRCQQKHYLLVLGLLILGKIVPLVINLEVFIGVELLKLNQGINHPK